MSDEGSKAGHWFAELRRRKVFRVAAVYLVVAWLLVQVAGTTFEPMGLPPWTLKLVITLVALGFPLACGARLGIRRDREGHRADAERRSAAAARRAASDCAGSRTALARRSSRSRRRRPRPRIPSPSCRSST